MRILEVCCDLDGGGSDRYVFNYCTRIKDIHFDYSAVDNRRGMLEPLLEEKGSSVYHVPQIKKGPIKYYQSVKRIMKNGQYDAVHVHLGHKSFLALLAAKRIGIKVRIAHAHIAFVPENIAQKLIRRISTFITKLLITDYAACGVDAAKWVWGQEYNKGNVTVINNAIETSKFSYSCEMREKIRESFGINDDVTVIGHVGRLSDQKNQLRLLEIFQEMMKIKSNIMLVLIGHGEMENEIKQKIRELGINEKVLLLGIRNDVQDLLNMMDVFVFPSKYEGLPFTLIETQCNGLRCICSDTVTSLVKVSDMITFMSLNDTSSEWAKEALELAKMGHSPSARDMVVLAGYDIDEEAQKLAAYYKGCIQRVGD